MGGKSSFSPFLEPKRPRTDAIEHKRHGKKWTAATFNALSWGQSTIFRDESGKRKKRKREDAQNVNLENIVEEEKTGASADGGERGRLATCGVRRRNEVGEMWTYRARKNERLTIRVEEEINQSFRKRRIIEKGKQKKGKKL